MFKTTFLIAICLGLGLGLIALAQGIVIEEDTAVEEEIIEDVNLDQEVTAEDLEVKEPKLLPDSRFYFLKNWGRGIRSFFTFNKVKKAELESRFADERLIEIKKMIEEGRDKEEIKKAIEEYKKTVDKVKTRAEKIKQKARENPKVEKFLEKYTYQQILHEKVLEKLENQVSPEVYERIKEARERHLERFGEVMIKLEDRKEKIEETLENTLEKVKGSKYKNFKNLEVLMRLEEKVPEQAKEAIRGAQENALKRLQSDLEKMSPQDQERFKVYIDRISGDEEKHLEILENLKAELKENPELREKMQKAREKLLDRERVRELNCPEIEKPALGFCVKGRIIIERDEKGCLIEFKCVIPGDITPSPGPEACITLWDPVCGTNGKTYSNACFAKTAGVEIDYKGRCREKESLTECQNADDCNKKYPCFSSGSGLPETPCPQLRCSNGKCINTTKRCVKEAKGLRLDDAERIALTGECGQKGTLKGTVVCNEDTGTWWIDLDVFEKKQGCNPACVVNVVTKEAEINWRCTGVITRTIELPKTKEECLRQGGTWGPIGLLPKAVCNLKTSDKGKSCTDSDQCEGSCIGEDINSTEGKCSEWRTVVGCHPFVENGNVGGILCVD